MKNSPYSKDNVRHGVMHYVLGRGVAGLAGFATVVLLVRFMDIQGYAAYTALSGLISFAGILASLGMERTLSRYIPEARLERSAHELGRLIWLTTFARVSAASIVCLFLWAFWPYLLHIFKDIHIEKLPITLLCFLIAETLFQHFSSALQALVQQKTLTGILGIQWAGRLVMIFFATMSDSFITLDEALWIMAVPELLGVIVFIIVLITYLKNLNNEQGEFKTDTQHQNTHWPDWSVIFKTAGNNYSYLLIAAPPQGYFMKMITAFFLSAEYVAAYGFFISVAERVRQYIPLHFFYNILEPVMIAAYIKDKNFDNLSQRCQLLYKSNLLLMVPAIAWVAVSGDATVSLITGGKFEGLSWILVLVMIQLTIGSHVVLLQLILNTIEKSRSLVHSSIYSLAAMAVFMLIAIPIYAPALLVSSTVFSSVMNLYIIHKIQSFNYQYRPSWGMLKGVIFSGLIAYILVVTGLSFIKNQLNHFEIALSSFIAVFIIYMAALWFMKSITTSEVKLVKSMLVRS